MIRTDNLEEEVVPKESMTDMVLDRVFIRMGIEYENSHYSLIIKITQDIILNTRIMGGSQSVLYNVPVTQKTEGESAIYRHPSYKDQITGRPAPHLATMKDILINSFKQYASYPSLGKIVNGEVVYITYKEAHDMAQQLGSAMANEKLYNQNEGEKMKMFGIFSKNRLEWTVADMAACLYGFTTIPIYDTLGDENITYVFEHTQLTNIFVNEGGVKALMKCKDLVNIKNIISFDPLTEQQTNFFQAKGVNLISYASLLQKGKLNKVDYTSEQFKVLPEDIVTFSYTSGTTGPPKGAMMSHKNFVSFMAAERFHKDTKFTSDDVALSYLPLPHILQRQFDYALLCNGSKIVYFSGDVQKLKDDLAIVKPTIFLSVPRLYSRFYEVLTAKFNEVKGMTKKALDYALSTKLDNLKSTGVYTHRIYDMVFFAKTREALGGRVRLMVSGSAPLLPEVQNFLKVCMCAPLLEGYGQTESTGAMLITNAEDPIVSHVGGPVCSFEIKLVDIPEMQYRSTDKDAEGNSTPRGEIWCRGPGVFSGYYHDEVKTKQALTQDGWLKTGDVGSMSAKSKAIKIIDRKKNIFKLQQGEYVAAEKVQIVLMKGDKLAEIFIHGQSTQTFVIAIAVPHKKSILAFAETLKIQGQFEQLCKNEKIRAEYVIYLNKIGKEGGLVGFQQVKNIYLQPTPFALLGLVTNTAKIQRHQAKKHFKPQVDIMYKEGMLKTDKK